MSFAEGDTCKLMHWFDGVAYGPEYLTLQLNERVRFAYTDADDPSWSHVWQLSCTLQGWFPTTHLELVLQSTNSQPPLPPPPPPSPPPPLPPPPPPPSAVGPTLNNGTSALHTWSPFPPSEDMKNAWWDKAQWRLATSSPTEHFRQVLQSGRIDKELYCEPCSKQIRLPPLHKCPDADALLMFIDHLRGDPTASQ